ncbi:hypothetical protein ACFX12_035983 [Malus domestica]
MNNAILRTIQGNREEDTGKGMRHCYYFSTSQHEARTCQVESLAAEVISLKQEIRGLKHENKQLHMLTHDYATNMKRKLDQMQKSDGQALLDHQRFVGLFQRNLLPSSYGAVPHNETPNDQPPMPPPSGVLSSTEAPDNHPPVLSLYRALPTAETSPKQHL